MIVRYRIPLILAGLLFASGWSPDLWADDPLVKKAESPPAKPATAEKPVEAGKPAEAAKPGTPPKTEPAKPAEKGAAAKKSAPNPLTNLIRNVFRSPSKNKQTAKEAEANDPDSKLANSGDQTDKRAPHDPEQYALLQKAAEKIRDKNWNEALEIIEFLLERGENSTIRLATGRRVPLSEEANRLLGTLPPEVRESYRITHGPAAAQLLAEAVASGDPRRYSEVATRYFHTPAGFDAANHLGTLHFDCGEFGMAARWFNLLIEADAPVSSEPNWRLKAVFALRQSGQQPRSDELLSALSSEANRREYEIGGLKLDPREWLSKLRPIATDAVPALEEWPIFGGGPSRSAVAKGGEPLLLSRWTRPISESHPLLEQIEMLTQDLADQQRATIPALFPLMVNNRIIFRTLRGVQVLDATTGEPLWETREGVSAERMLLGGEVDEDGERVVVGRRAFNNIARGDYFGGGGESHPLIGLLYRNGAFGVLASDARQLFVIEDHAMLSRMGYYGNDFDPDGEDPFHQNWSTNRLVSYDQNTGRPLWTVGGVAMNEPFDLPLAGTYFLGAPLVEGGELLIAGEKEGRIHLFALDPATGLEKWSQLIAYADSKIDRDIARRWWTAQISSASGVIVCPTTVGWLVGIDRLNHSILWTSRYTAPADPRTLREGREEADSMVAFSELNTQWAPSAPIISGNRVIYTPSEEGVLICVDLFDGKEVWKSKPKGEDGLYVAGVFDDRIVIVGRTSIIARSMKDGEVAWTIRLTPADGRPSGIGIAAKGKYYLPLSNGQLWTIDPVAGTVVTKSTLPDGARALGNLALYRGMFLSLTAEGLTSYEQRESAQAEIRRRKEANPHDPEALLHEAEILRVDRKYVEALKSLHDIKPADVPESLKRRYRSAMLDSLAGVIRGDNSGATRELDELGAFASTPEEKWLHRALRIEQFAAKKEYPAAFDLLLEVTGKLEDVPPLAGSDPDTELDANVWVAGQLATFWEKLDADARKKFDERIRKEIKTALDGDLAARRNMSRTFAFHPAVDEIQDRLVEDYAKSGDIVLAENILLKRARRGEPAKGAAALERLARLLTSAGLPHDAERVYADLERRFPDVPVAGKPARELVAELRKAGTIGHKEPEKPFSWGDIDLKVERTGSGYLTQHVQEVETAAGKAPFFRDHRLQIDERRQRLEVIGAHDETQHWLLPLRSSQRPMQGDQIVARTSGHMLFLMHRDVLHCLSPVDRKVLWTRGLEVRGSGGGYYRVPQRNNIQPLRIGSSFNSRNSVLHLDRGDGMLAAANSECVCVYGRREFTVLDALTGEVLWKRGNVPPNANVIATDDVLYFVPPDKKQAVAYRAADGRPLEMKDITAQLSKAVAIVPAGIVFSDADGKGAILGLAANKAELRLYDPLARKDLWKLSLPGGTAFALLDDTRLVSLEATGTPSILDLETGEMRRFESSIPKDELKAKPDFYVLADQDRIYFAMNKRRSGDNYYYQDNFQSVVANGTLYAFDIHNGKELWKQEIASQNLVSQFLNYSPALLFVSRAQSKRGDGGKHWSLNLLALDKQTGRKLIGTQLPTYTGFRTLDLNMAEKFIELRSHNQRVRLMAVERGK